MLVQAAADGRRLGILRVLHIQKATGVSGSERHLLALLPRLQESGLEVRLCVLVAGAGSLFVEAMRTAGVETIALPAGPDLNPLLVPRLVHEIRRFAPSLVHTHLIHGDLFGQAAALFARIPSVSTVHGTHAFYRRQPYRRLASLAWRNARSVIAISRWISQFVTEERLVDRDRVRVVPYGIDVAAWQRGEAERAQAREALAIAPEDVVFGVASRLVPHKGHSFLLDAFRRALPLAPSARLLVAGDGPLRASLEDQARRDLPAGACRFIGFTANVGGFMNACDALVFPTMPEFGEGFGLAALEAMAAGRAVVATRVGPLPEVVSHGESGFLVEANDPGALAGALIELATDRALLGRLGTQARERAASSFRLDEMVGKTRSIYVEALGTGDV